MQCILSRWFGHWRTESSQGAIPPPPTAPEAVVDNLRCHQWRQSRHHGNSRPSVDVLRVEISAKANLPLSQVPPPRRRDACNATSVVLSSLDFPCPYGRAPTCQRLACHKGCVWRLSVASEKWWEFPLVTWAQGTALYPGCNDMPNLYWDWPIRSGDNA